MPESPVGAYPVFYESFCGLNFHILKLHAKYVTIFTIRNGISITLLGSVLSSLLSSSERNFLFGYGIGIPSNTLECVCVWGGGWLVEKRGKGTEITMKLENLRLLIEL